MSWVPAFDALHDIEDRRERAAEAERQRRLERARRLASNGHLNPIQLPIVAAVSEVAHHYNPLPIVSGGIDALKPACSCGWQSRRTVYTDQIAKRLHARHVSAKTRGRT